MPDVTTAPSVEQFVPLARKLAHRLAWEPSDEDDLMQEACIALHAALQKTPRPDNPWAFARTVLTRTMKSCYPASRRAQAKRFLPLDSLCDEQGQAPLPPALICEPDFDDQPSILDAYLSDLESACGRQARWAAENLLEPGDAFGRFVLIEVEEKQRANAERCGGPQLRGVEQIRISHRQLREALGLNPPRWQSLLAEIRTFTREWMARRLGCEGPAQGRTPAVSGKACAADL